MVVSEVLIQPKNWELQMMVTPLQSSNMGGWCEKYMPGRPVEEIVYLLHS